MPGKSRGPHDRRASSSENAAGERLQKVLAAAGIGSRRECEQLIEEGRVEIDRDIVSKLGTRVDPTQQEVRVDGVPLPRTRRVCYAVNKPVGVVCTNHDPSGRMRVIDLLPKNDRIFTVGRLDRSSEGLILVTNDGELANLLTHPRYGVDKVYRVKVAGHPPPELLRQLQRGIHLAEGFVRVAAVHVKRRFREAVELELVLNEGRNREIRRSLARIGHKVLQLKRTAIGSIRLGDMPAGAYRQLTAQEIKRLRSESQKASGTDSKRRKSKSSTLTPTHSAGRAAQVSGKAGSERPSSGGGTVLAYDEVPPRKKRQSASPSGRTSKRATRRPK